MGEAAGSAAWVTVAVTVTAGVGDELEPQAEMMPPIARRPTAVAPILTGFPNLFILPSLFWHSASVVFNWPGPR